jgi:hypothetical protein
MINVTYKKIIQSKSFVRLNPSIQEEVKITERKKRFPLFIFPVNNIPNP